MLQNAYFLAKIGADTAENERTFAKKLSTTLQLPYPTLLLLLLLVSRVSGRNELREKVSLVVVQLASLSGGTMTPSQSVTAYLRSNSKLERIKKKF